MHMLQYMQQCFLHHKVVLCHPNKGSSFRVFFLQSFGNLFLDIIMSNGGDYKAISIIFTLFYVGLYLLLVIIISVYCWVKLEDEIIYQLLKLTKEYKKIARKKDINDGKSIASHMSTEIEMNKITSNTGQESPVISVNSDNKSEIMSQFDVDIFIQKLGKETFIKPIPDVYYYSVMNKIDDMELKFDNDYNDEMVYDIEGDNTMGLLLDMNSPSKQLINIANIAMQPSNLSVKTDEVRKESISVNRSEYIGNDLDRDKAKEFGKQLSCKLKFGYWVWISWNMSSIYGLLIIHIWDLGTDIGVIFQWYILLYKHRKYRNVIYWCLCVYI